MSEARPQIRAALAGNKKLLLSALYEACTDDPLLVKGAVSRMVRTGELLKHAGLSARLSLYSLSPGFVEGLPKIKRGKPEKPAGKKRAQKPSKRAALRPVAMLLPGAEYISAPPAAFPFTVALTADLELLIVGPHGPQLFSAEHTQQIATLALDRFTT